MTIIKMLQYMRLSENISKAEYVQFLDETIDMFRLQNNNGYDELCSSILEQLLDIKKNVVELEVLSEWDEINERYTLGGLAIKNFDENEELGLRVQEVFWGALEFVHMR